MKAGFEALKPGVTEREIAGIMHEVMFAEGATESGLMCLYAGPRLMWADSTPSDYKIQKGDVIQFDGGCIYEGYWTDFKRMASIGEPRPEQRRYFELAKQGFEAAISVMKAGVTAGEVLQAAFEVNNRAGNSDFSSWCLENGLRAIGHSIGVNIHEHPGLSHQSSFVLEAGMAFAVEPFITLNGHYPFHEALEKYGLEDNVIVTEDGVEVMTREDYITHELWIA